MTTEQLLMFHTTTCNKARELMARKNHDYAGKDGTTPFANFEVVGHMNICKPEVGILVRLSDKLKRIVEYINSGEFKVKDESFEDTIIDAINYNILLLAKVVETKEQNERTNNNS